MAVTGAGLLAATAVSASAGIACVGPILLREAIARDPNYGRALAGAAWCASQLVTGGWAEGPETDRREALWSLSSNRLSVLLISSWT
jgi:hypothetical protein